MFDPNFEILKTMKATPTVLRELTKHLDKTQASWRPAFKEWAVVEVVAHMADVDERALARLRRMLNEEHPMLPSFDPEALAEDRGYRDMDLTEEVQRYADSRRAHVDLLASLSADAWDRTGRHEVQGNTTVRLYETHVAAEDVDHLAQIADVLSRLPRR